MNLFGKKQSKAAPAAVVANPADTIKLLRDSLDTLEKREIHIGKRVDMALLEAKQKAAKKDKRGLSILVFLDIFELDFRKTRF
jgi:charged multivesicular body protein 4